MSKTQLKSKQKPRTPKILLSLVIIVVIAACVIGILQATHTIHLFSKSVPADKVIVKVGNSSPSSTPAKNNSSAGASQPKTTTINNGTRAIGGVTNTNGSVTASTPSSQWVTSASGAITVKQPVANATIQNSATLSGVSKVNQVQYTLIDNSVGVISQGTLNVVNGNFSGAMSFTPHSSGGRLDVYSTEANGAQINEIQIEVNF